MIAGLRRTGRPGTGRQFSRTSIFENFRDVRGRGRRGRRRPEEACMIGHKLKDTPLSSLSARYHKLSKLEIISHTTRTTNNDQKDFQPFIKHFVQ